MRIPLGGRWITTFVLLSLVCLGAHELVHHLAARALCGEWGTMTFWTFHLAEGCEPTGRVLLATLAGPVTTYALMYAGLALIARGRALAGTTLVLANLPLARLVTVLMRGGDEMVLGRAWIGAEAAWPVLMTLTVLLLALPVIAAWRAIESRRKPLLFAALLVLPLFVDMLIKRLLLARMLEVWPAEVAGIPILFLLVMAVALVALAWLISRGALGRQASGVRLQRQHEDPARTSRLPSLTPEA